MKSAVTLNAFLIAVAALLHALDECDNLPPSVTAACDQIRQAAAMAAGPDAGAPS